MCGHSCLSSTSKIYRIQAKSPSFAFKPFFLFKDIFLIKISSFHPQYTHTFWKTVVIWVVNFFVLSQSKYCNISLNLLGALWVKWPQHTFSKTSVPQQKADSSKSSCMIKWATLIECYSFHCNLIVPNWEMEKFLNFLFQLGADI